MKYLTIIISLLIISSCTKPLHKETLIKDIVRDCTKACKSINAEFLEAYTDEDVLLIGCVCEEAQE